MIQTFQLLLFSTQQFYLPVGLSSSIRRIVKEPKFVQTVITMVGLFSEEH